MQYDSAKVRVTPLRGRRNGRVGGFLMDPIPEPTKTLTPMELWALKLRADETVERPHLAMGVTYQSYKSYMTQCRRKLNAKDAAECVVVAMRLGILS